MNPSLACASFRRSLALAAIALILGLSEARSQTSTIRPINATWRYQQTQNLNGSNWTAAAFNDSAWPSGPALLYSESNTAVSPRNTPLTLGRITYYFRSGFNFSGPTNHFLVFSNKVDDGAVFYLNGQEIKRIRMPASPTVITYTNFATATPSGGDATGWDVFSIPATSAVIGTNVLAVEVHQRDTNSTDIVFGSALALRPPSLVRGPYLQSGSSTNVIIRWRTDGANDSVVSFGTNVANLNWQVTDAAITTEHELLLSGLSPDTKYFYSVGSSQGILQGGNTNFFFVTSPVPGTPKSTRIWVLGDPGTADLNQSNVRDAYYAYTAGRETDLILMLGDNAYDNGTDEEYQAAVFDMYADQLRRTVLWSTLGNHETAQSTAFVDTYPYFQMFTFPTNGSAGGEPSLTEHYFSFDYGNIHFICLDSMTASRSTNGLMADWLQRDLARNTNDWLIAFWHHPPYTKGSHNSDTETPLIQMRTTFLPILEAAGVDLVLAGHSHSYERSYLIDGHYGSSINLLPTMILNSGSGHETNAKGPYTKWLSGPPGHQGAVYATAGSSGKISGGTLNHPAMFISTNRLGSMVLDVSSNRMDARFIRENGEVIDYFTMVKRDVELELTGLSADFIDLHASDVASGKTNLLQGSTTLSTWETISTNLSSSNQLHIVLPRSNDDAHKFFRLQRLP